MAYTSQPIDSIAVTSYITFETEAVMATLTIRNLDDDIREFLRVKAAENGRSMEAEIRHILSREAKQGNASPHDVFTRIHKLFSDIGGADDLVLPKREAAPKPPDFHG